MFQTEFVVALVMLFILLPAARFVRRFVYALFDMFDRGNPVDEAGRSALSVAHTLLNLAKTASIGKLAFGSSTGGRGGGGGPAPASPAASQKGVSPDRTAGIMNEQNLIGDNGLGSGLGKGKESASMKGSVKSSVAGVGMEGLGQTPDVSALARQDGQQDSLKTYGYLPEKQAEALQATGTDGMGLYNQNQSKVVPIDAARSAKSDKMLGAPYGTASKLSGITSKMAGTVSTVASSASTAAKTGLKLARITPAGRVLGGAAALAGMGNMADKATSAVTSVAQGAVGFMSGLQGSGSDVNFMRTTRQSSVQGSGSHAVERTGNRSNVVPLPARSPNSAVSLTRSAYAGNRTTGNISAGGNRYVFQHVRGGYPGRASHSGYRQYSGSVAGTNTARSSQSAHTAGTSRQSVHSSHVSRQYTSFAGQGYRQVSTGQGHVTGTGVSRSSAYIPKQNPSAGHVTEQYTPSAYTKQGHQERQYRENVQTQEQPVIRNYTAEKLNGAEDNA